MQFDWFHRASVAIAEMPLDAEIPPVLPEERPFVVGAVPSRVREFAAGRACARLAMDALSEPPCPIGVLSDRTPDWPQAMTGSITHSKTHCAAAIVRKGGGVRAVGIDLEPAEALDADLVSSVCRDEEVAWLSRHADPERLLLAKLIFSAKECAYKCQYAISRKAFGFEDMALELDLDRERFSATLLRPFSPFPVGARIAGEFRISPTHIACAAVLVER